MSKNTPDTVLIIDDDEDFAETTASLLRLEGFRTVVAFNAKSAFEKLTDDIDVVLSDIKLGMDSGSTLIAKIRDQFDIPVIMITAYASTDTAIESLKNRAFDYLLKPCDPREIINSVMRAAQEVRHRKSRSVMRREILHELEMLKQ